VTILYAGGEDTSGTITGTVAVVTTTSLRRTAYSRCALAPVRTGNTTVPPTNRLATPVWTAGNSLWVHAIWNRVNLGNSFTTSGIMFALYSPDGVVRLLLRGASADALKISKRNSAGTITDIVTSSTLSRDTVNHQIDWRISYQATGGQDLYVDGVNVATDASDPRTDAATQLDHMLIATPGSVADDAYSEFIVADEDTRPLALWTLAPVASGVNQLWTPNTVGNINEVTIDDSTLVATSTNDQQSEWTVPTTPPTGSWTVKALVQEARVSVGATGPQHFDWIVNVGGTDYTAGLSVAPTNVLSNFANRIWATNPATSAAWSLSDITAPLSAGIISRS
jgi:hypothetical protein